MSEEEKIKWLIDELNTKRPLIPSDVTGQKLQKKLFQFLKWLRDYNKNLEVAFVILM
jgi:phosphoenolpyruvate carboxylase